jgi:hypothetical protein
MGAAITMRPTAGQTIAKSDLLRLEGLGDNCELGFVLRRLGFEDGMLFRWASIRPESLLATLRGDCADLYEFGNLVPQNAKMVRDLHYGTSWHTRCILRCARARWYLTQTTRPAVRSTAGRRPN